MQEYQFQHAGMTLTALLSDEDVKRYNATPVKAKKAPAHKARTPANKAD